MSVPLTEFFIEMIIREGLNDIKDNPLLIDMLFSKFTLPIFSKEYGQRTIDEIKQYILEDKVAVVQAWTLIPEKVPCYSININNTEESPETAFFGDNAGWVERTADPVVLLTFVPVAYNPVSGFVDAGTTNLSALYDGAIFVDAAGNRFPIIGPIFNEDGQHWFSIGTDKTVVLGESRVTGIINVESAPFYETPLYEEIQIGVHAAENSNLCKFLYYILIYILQSKRLLLEKLGLQIHTFSVADFVKLMDLLPDNILNRFVVLKLLVWFGWEGELFQGVEGLGEMRIKVDRDKWINRGDDTIITTNENDD